MGNKEQQILTSKMGLIQIQLDKQTKAIFGEETKLKRKVDFLRKTIQSNYTSKLALEAKIEKATLELSRCQKENQKRFCVAEEKVRVAETKSSDADNLLIKGKTELKQLESKRNALQMEYKEFKSETDNACDILTTKEKELENDFNILSKKVADLEGKIKTIKDHSIKLNTEKRYYEEECIKMRANIKTDQENLKNLTILTGKKELELEREQALNTELEIQVDNTQQRIDKRKIENKNLLESRRDYLRKIMKELRNELDKNKNLAIIFREIQAYNLAAKQAVLSVNEKRYQIETCVAEQEKLIKLQEKTCSRLGNVLKAQKTANSARVQYLNYTQELNNNALGVIKNDLLKSTKDVDKFIAKYVKS